MVEDEDEDEGEGEDDDEDDEDDGRKRVNERKLMSVRDMARADVGVQGVFYDWSDHEQGADWDYVSACRCDECGAVVAGQGEDEIHKDLMGGTCGGSLSLPGPMMNYFYPVTLGGEDWCSAVAKLADLPLCLISLGDSHALALTGGGMNLSWEICEAYMRLGNLPPVAFAEGLPQLAGKKLGPVERWVLSGCLASCAEYGRRAKRAAQRVRNVRGRMLLEEQEGDRR